MYMDTARVFEGSSIREVDFSSDVIELNDMEIEQINGGALWVPIAACVASTACQVAVLAAAGAIAAGVGYYVNRV